MDDRNDDVARLVDEAYERTANALGVSVAALVAEVRIEVFAEDLAESVPSWYSRPHGDTDIGAGCN